MYIYHNLALVCPKLSAEYVTAKALFESLYLFRYWKKKEKIFHHSHTPIVRLFLDLRENLCEWKNNFFVSMIRQVMWRTHSLPLLFLRKFPRAVLNCLGVWIRLNRFFHLGKNRNRYNRFIYCDLLRFFSRKSG